MTSPLTYTTRFWIMMSLLLLTACAGKPTPERCKNLQTTTTACKIPSPPIVEKKVLFDETVTSAPVKVTYPRPKTTPALLKGKPAPIAQVAPSASHNIKLYSIQFGAFRQTQTLRTLQKISKQADGAVIYRYPLTEELTGMSVGSFNSFKEARTLEKVIQKNIAADAYIRMLPKNAKVLNQ